MEYLIIYSSVGILCGFCYDIIIFFFGRNSLHGALFDIVLIGTPVIFMLIGIALYLAERFASKSASNYKAVPVNILTLGCALLAGCFTYLLGITDSLLVITIFALIGTFSGIMYIRPYRVWDRNKPMAFALPMITSMAVSFYSILLFSAILVLVIFVFLLIGMAFSDAA